MTNPITSETTVNEAVQLCPEAVEIFRDAGIDTCCGGPLTLAEATRRHQLDCDALLGTLNDLVDAAAPSCRL